MAKRKHVSWGFVLFIVLMLLMIAIGVFLMVYGSMHNDLALPRLPGDSLIALREELPHV